MTYQESIDFLYSQLPMFTKQGQVALKKDLTNTLALCKLLGNPQRRFKTIHVGGTNGKGSVSHMLAAVLQLAGYKTGLYTSPHLKDFRERIRIDGQMIPQQQVRDFVKYMKEGMSIINPSFFEATVAMAFDYFSAEKVDIAIIEVGLGGRLDSTNIIDPELSVITNISFDHTAILGNTLAEIAFEKAGIVKLGRPVVIGQKQIEVQYVFEKKAKEMHSRLTFASDQWKTDLVSTSSFPAKMHMKARSWDGREHSIESDLTGVYQLKNISTTLACIDELKKLGYTITDGVLLQAFKDVQKLTGLTGRWYIKSNNPLLVFDTGHNEDGIREVLASINNTSFARLHFVLGMVKDKDASAVLKLLPKNASYYFCAPKLERAKPVRELLVEAQQAGLEGNTFTSVKDALEAAQERADKEDLILIGGSTFVVAEVI